MLRFHANILATYDITTGTNEKSGVTTRRVAMRAGLQNSALVSRERCDRYFFFFPVRSLFILNGEGLSTPKRMGTSFLPWKYLVERALKKMHETGACIVVFITSGRKLYEKKQEERNGSVVEKTSAEKKTCATLVYDGPSTVPEQFSTNL